MHLCEWYICINKFLPFPTAPGSWLQVQTEEEEEEEDWGRPPAGCPAGPGCPLLTKGPADHGRSFSVKTKTNSNYFKVVINFFVKLFIVSICSL